ncbi:MAG: M56 family metallopeptidase [Prosthecobacter sp.]
MTPLLVLDLVVKSLAILLLAFAAQALWRRASACQRSLTWLAAFVGLLAVPLTLLIEPRWAPVAEARLAPGMNPAGQVVTLLPAAKMPQAHETMKAESQAWWRRLSLLQAAGLCWLAGMACVLGHRMLGIWQLRQLRAQSILCEDTRLLQQVTDLAQSLGIRRSIRVLSSVAAAVPVTWGVWRPVLLLPQQALGWNEEAQLAALTHELGHIRHWDAAGRWLATVACALQWWNPLAWAAARSWRKVQEQAADDLVLRCGAPAQDYAMQLLEAARSFQEGRFQTAPVLAMARPSSLETRLCAIMDTGRSRRSAGRRTLSAAAFAALLVLGGLSTVSLQGQPVKPKASTEPAKPQAAQKKQVGTVVTVLKAPAGHFTGNPQIISGMILPGHEAETMRKAAGVYSESTPRVITGDRQKVIIGDHPDSESLSPLRKEITLQPAIRGEAVHLDVGFSMAEEAEEGADPAAAGKRIFNTAVDVPAGLTAVVVLPAVEKQPDIVLLISPVFVAAPPPWFSAEERAAKIILPRVQFAEATVEEVIDALREDFKKLDPAHKGINILKIGGEGARLSLDLKEVSLKDALGHVAKAAGLDIQYDNYAVVLGPRGFSSRSAGLQPGADFALAGGKASYITLPQMDFHQTVLADVVAFLRKKAQSADPPEVRFDIVLNDESPAAKKLITFHLEELSMLDLLHYVALMGDYALTANKESVVLSPAGP